MTTAVDRLDVLNREWRRNVGKAQGPQTALQWAVAGIGPARLWPTGDQPRKWLNSAVKDAAADRRCRGEILEAMASAPPPVEGRGRLRRDRALFSSSVNPSTRSPMTCPWCAFARTSPPVGRANQVGRPRPTHCVDPPAPHKVVYAPPDCLAQPPYSFHFATRASQISCGEQTLGPTRSQSSPGSLGPRCYAGVSGRSVSAAVTTCSGPLSPPSSER